LETGKKIERLKKVIIYKPLNSKPNPSILNKYVLFLLKTSLLYFYNKRNLVKKCNIYYIVERIIVLLT